MRSVVLVLFSALVAACIADLYPQDNLGGETQSPNQPGQLDSYTSNENNDQQASCTENVDTRNRKLRRDSGFCRFYFVDDVPKREDTPKTDNPQTDTSKKKDPTRGGGGSPGTELDKDTEPPYKSDAQKKYESLDGWLDTEGSGKPPRNRTPLNLRFRGSCGSMGGNFMCCLGKLVAGIVTGNVILCDDCMPPSSYSTASTMTN